MFIIAGSMITPATRPSWSAASSASRVVERHDPRVLGGAGGVAEAVGDRVRVLARSPIWSGGGLTETITAS